MVVIRIVMSLAAISCMKIATSDVKKAYLQSGFLDKDAYMRPPKGWDSSRATVWKLLRPAYVLVESGRIWQLAIEKCFREGDIVEFPDLPQLFIMRRHDGRILLTIAQVVDDVLIVWNNSDIM